MLLHTVPHGSSSWGCSPHLSSDQKKYSSWRWGREPPHRWRNWSWNQQKPTGKPLKPLKTLPSSGETWWNLSNCAWSQFMLRDLRVASALECCDFSRESSPWPQRDKVPVPTSIWQWMARIVTRNDLHLLLAGPFGQHGAGWSLTSVIFFLRPIVGVHGKWYGKVAIVSNQLKVEAPPTTKFERLKQPRNQVRPNQFQCNFLCTTSSPGFPTKHQVTGENHRNV